MKDDEIRMTVRLPKLAAEFLDEVAKENFTSRNAEIVRSVRERKERKEAAGEKTKFSQERC
jgi:hypothetical protein